MISSQFPTALKTVRKTAVKWKPVFDSVNGIRMVFKWHKGRKLLNKLEKKVFSQPCMKIMVMKKKIQISNT